ncbi:endonuclease [Pseudaeromonas sharmana]|uniref:Endonuclease n=1 Tax=Pseudaeromonas sharmana TaxID=328412 RepID=A0ABV8CJ45_9GAMM
MSYSNNDLFSPRQLRWLAATLWLSLPLSAHAAAASAAQPQTFVAAKKALFKLYQANPQQTTFYCGCPIRYQGKKMVPDLERCGYKVRKQATRAARIEWEHIMPAADFGRQRLCWQEGGRKSCVKNDPGFAQIEGDMHNLVPAIGEVNGDRGDLGFSDWNAATGMYGQCEMVIDFKRRQAQPPQRSRGAIARAYLYMAERHQLRLSDQQRKLYNGWNRQYPVSRWECERDEAIARLQGNHNRFVQEQCD